jgi:HSP20 family molecular chaperone IbpA
MFKFDDMMDDLEREMRRLSDEMLVQMFRLPGATGEVWAPRVDVYETTEDLVVKVCAAGVKPEDLEIALSADSRYLTIRGYRSEESEDKRGRIKYYQLEVYYGPFERVLRIPQSIRVDRENLKAVYKDGFLKISLPKLPEPDQIESRIIPITE